MIKTIAPAITIFFTKLFICSSKGVFSSFMLSKLLPILPNLVSLPTAVTEAMANPLATVVPLKIKLSSFSTSL